MKNPWWLRHLGFITRIFLLFFMNIYESDSRISAYCPNFAHLEIAPTWEIGCVLLVLGAGLQPEVGDGGRLRADGHAYHVLHLVDAVALGAAPGQLREPLALPDQNQPLWKILGLLFSGVVRFHGINFHH